MCSSTIFWSTQGTERSMGDTWGLLYMHYRSTTYMQSQVWNFVVRGCIFGPSCISNRNWGGSRQRWGSFEIGMSYHSHRDPEFLGLDEYYRSFIQGSSSLAASFTRLVRKEEHFLCGPLHVNNVFNPEGDSRQLECLPYNLVMRISLCSDTSGIRLSYILMQRGRLIAYASW